MKQRPILFSGSMVRAILEGRKTVTRRPAKEQPRDRAGVGSYGVGQPFIRHPNPTKRNLACPYGQPGDRMWVREAWVADAQVNSIAPRDLSQGEPIWYPADGSIRQTGCAMISQGKSRPSIHMPRWASRILLEITAVRVERLQDISEEQAIAEGIIRAASGWRGYEEGPWFASPVGAFSSLWEQINGPDSWAANPWVWVVDLKRLTP